MSQKNARWSDKMNCEELKVSLGNPIIGKNNNVLDRKLKVDRQNNIRSVTTTCLDSITADPSVLQRFYSGCSVFVTGATGFMGKVLLEKLLRSCPDLDMIYILVREKKGRSLEERIDDLLSSPCFDRLKKEYPKFRSKLTAVAGDIGLKGLGIQQGDRMMLQLKVDIVFHVAATVRFDEELKTAILQNVRGTRELITLCRTFPKLKGVLHVSTAYSHCPNEAIAEQLYDAPLDCRKAIEMAENMDTQDLEQLSHSLIGKWPNSYAFTKAISEDVIRVFGQGLPIAVFRPSIVVSTLAEPMSGWIDNLYGPTGVIVGVTAGLIRTLQVGQNIQANIVPCDMVINAMAASAWEVSTTRSSKVPVYNFVSPEDNKLTWREFTDNYIKYGRENPPVRCMWYWTITMCSSRAGYLLLRVLLHLLPALLIDLLLMITNNKPQLIRAYKKIHKFSEVISYFAMRHWRFADQNIVDLWDRLDPRDQEMFFFDMRSLDWDSYIKDTCLGLREFLMKDTLDTIPAGRIRFKRLYVIHRFTQLLLICLLLWFCSYLASFFYTSRTSP